MKIKRAVIRLGVMVCLGGIGWYFLLPAAIQKAVTKACASMGYNGATVDVGRITLRHAVLHNLRVTEQLDLHVADIRAHYRFWDLLHLRVDRVEIRDVTLHLPGDFRPPQPAAKHAEASSDRRLPFNQVELHQALLEIEGWAGPHRIRVSEALLKHEKQGRLQLVAQLLVQDTPAKVSAVINPRLSALQGSLDAPRLDLAYWGSLVGEKFPGVEIHGGGQVQLLLNAEWGEERSIRLFLIGEEAQLTVQRDDTELSTSWKTLALVLNGSSDHPKTFTGRAACEGLVLHSLPADMRLSDISGALPWYWNAPQPGPGEALSLKVGRMQGRGLELTNIAARLAVVDRELKFELSAPLYAGSALRASGSIHPGNGLHLDSLELPAVPIPDPSEPGRHFPALADLQISGTPSVHGARARWDGRLLEAHAEVDLDRMSIQSKQWDFNLEGLRAALRVDQEGEFLTPAVQEIRVASLKLGELQLQDGVLRFTVYTNGTVQVESMSFNWGVGKLVCRDFALRPGMSELDVRLEFEHIELASLLRLAAAGKAEGAGSLSGYWDVGLAWSPTLELHLGTGSLDADPGGGWFKVMNADAAAQLVKLGGGNTADKALMDKIQRAIYDFRYDILKIAFESQPEGGIMTRIHGEGEGPRGAQALRFGALDFNVDGLDDLLQVMLIRSDEMRREMESGVNEALKKYLGGSAKSASDEAAEQALEAAIDNFF